MPYVRRAVASARPDPRNPRGYAALLWGFVFVACAVTTGKVHIRGDSNLMCLAASSIADHGNLDIPGGVRDDAVLGADGLYYTNYPLGAILQCAPALGLRWLAREADERDGALEHFAVGLTPSAVTAFLALALFFLGRRLGFPLGVSTAVALLAVFSSPVWAYSRQLYSENLQGLMLVLSILTWIKVREQPTKWMFTLGGAVLGGLIHTKTPFFVVPLVVVFWFFAGEPSWRRTRDFLIFGALGALPFLVAWGWYNDLRFGSWLALGYSNQRAATIGFGTPFLAGAHGLLFGSGKSLFLYAPLALLALFGVPALHRADRRSFWLMAVPVIALFVVTAKWWAWSGDWGWAPRLLVPAYPVLFVPLFYVAQRRGVFRAAFVLLAVAGVVVNGLGCIIDDSYYIQTVARVSQAGLNIGVGPDPVRDDLVLVHFVPEFSPPVGHAWLLHAYVEGWEPTGWYPWKGIGIPAWRLTFDPTPTYLNSWHDGEGLAWKITAGCLALLALLAAAMAALGVRARRLSAAGRGDSRPPPPV